MGLRHAASSTQTYPESHVRLGEDTDFEHVVWFEDEEPSILDFVIATVGVASALYLLVDAAKWTIARLTGQGK